MLSFGPVRTDMDFDSPGKRAGFVDVAHSDNRLAFSSIRLPVGVIRGGAGPTVLLTAGNHGDEYEGQAILHRLMQGLAPEDVPGRLILLPALNLPAVLDRARVSPLDGGNMNRAFPGAADAGPTSAIAGFVDRHLIPISDAILDFHSGGTATEYVDCGFLGLGDNHDLNHQCLQLADWFGAPFTMLCPLDGSGGDFDTAAHRQGVPFLSCELGGMGRYSPASFRIGWNGCLRVLRALGCLGPEAGGDVPAAPVTRFIDIGPGGVHLTSDRHGLAEIDLVTGQGVVAGDTIGRIHDLHCFGTAPAPLICPRDGILAVRRHNPVVAPGDHLCLITEEVSRDTLRVRMGD
ncbi:MAG: succinylglutamate desuccinylase/aspartoacylase family protein [Albidovulum sp.]|uniref:succinylglutamate desuccinylase/aspartoacylase family protein n=1 Tax=Albidovulum sp. TaxID=1872424 RepID=UPI003CA4DA86